METESLYMDYFKAYNEMVGQYFERQRAVEKMWKQAELLNKIDMALQTRNEKDFYALRRELDGWM